MFNSYHKTMKKKRTGTWFPLKKSRAKILMVMKLTFLLMCGFVFSLSASVRAQDQMVTMKVNGVTFTKVISELKRQTQLDFFYSFNEVDVNQAISLDVKKVKVDDVLRQVLGNRFTWEYVDHMVIIKPVPVAEPEKKFLRVKGFVYDAQKFPMPGVTVKLVGTFVGTATDANGRFSVELPVTKGQLEFSFVGFRSQIVNISEKTANDTLKIIMHEDVQAIDEVVVTGYGDVSRKNYTGAATTVRAADILMPGVSSIDQMLQGVVPGLLVWNRTGGGNTQDSSSGDFDFIRKPRAGLGGRWCRAAGSTTF